MTVRLAVVVTADSDVDRMASDVEGNLDPAALLVLATRDASSATRSAAAAIEQRLPRVVHFDLDASVPMRRLLGNVARCFPVDAIALVEPGERLVIDAPDLLAVSLTEAAGRAVHVERRDPTAAPTRVTDRVFPCDATQLDLLLGRPEIGPRSPRHSSHLLDGLHLECGTARDQSAPWPLDLDDSARATVVAPAGAIPGAGSAADHGLPDGVFPAAFHAENLYLDLPPFRYTANVRRPTSVLDIGCGLGGYLDALGSMGAGRAVGVDGFERPDGFLGPGPYHAHDLRQPLSLGERFDLVVCTEVIEHLPPEHEAILLDSINNHAQDVILFSAARPGQPGSGHVNGQSTEHWTRAWRARGWEPDVFQTLAVRSLSTFHWFRRNFLVLVRMSEPSPFRLSDLVSFEASMVDWIGQPAAVFTRPLSEPLAPVRHHQQEPFGEPAS
jgi:hypothetical protein